MAAPQKFMFDKSFDDSIDVIDPLVELKARFEEKIKKAKAEAFAEGQAAGEKEALKNIANKTKEALENIAAQEQQIQKIYELEIQKLEAKSIEFGIAAGTSLASDLIRREPMPLIEKFFKEAFEIVRGVPQLTARINPTLAPATIEASKLWMSETGYSGELQFIEDPKLKDIDVAITWKDGGVSQSVDELMNSIKKALNNYFETTDLPPSTTAVPQISSGQLTTPDLSNPNIATPAAEITNQTLNKSESSL